MTAHCREGVRPVRRASWLLLFVTLAALTIPRPASAAALPQIPFPLRIQPNVGYFLPISGGIDTLFLGSLKIGVAAILPVWGRLEVEAGVENVFLDYGRRLLPGIRVKDRIRPITAGFRPKRRRQHRSLRTTTPGEPG